MSPASFVVAQYSYGFLLQQKYTLHFTGHFSERDTIRKFCCLIYDILLYYLSSLLIANTAAVFQTGYRFVLTILDGYLSTIQGIFLSWFQNYQLKMQVVVYLYYSLSICWKQTIPLLCVRLPSIDFLVLCVFLLWPGWMCRQHTYTFPTFVK